LQVHFAIHAPSGVVEDDFVLSANAKATKQTPADTRRDRIKELARTPFCSTVDVLVLKIIGGVVLILVIAKTSGLRSDRFAVNPTRLAAIVDIDTVLASFDRLFPKSGKFFLGHENAAVRIANNSVPFKCQSK
jgi:hypothetical protein